MLKHWLHVTVYSAGNSFRETLQHLNGDLIVDSVSDHQRAPDQVLCRYIVADAPTETRFEITVLQAARLGQDGAEVGDGLLLGY